MQLTTVAAFTALASTALATGSVVVKNNCGNAVFLTRTGSNQQSSQSQINPGGSYSQTISGQGNSWGVTTSSDYYSPNTAKLIWGWSDSAGTVYYSLNTVDGSPFSTVDIVSSDSSCPAVTSPDGKTVTCGDGATLTLNVC